MSDEGMAEAKATAEKSDIIVLVLGGSSARDFSAEFEATGAAKASRNELSDMWRRERSLYIRFTWSAK